METPTPSTVDGEGDVKSIEGNVVAQLSKPVDKSRKLKGSDVHWTPTEFYKDAAWFASNFGLPNEGETPHKISDLSEEQLCACFGEGSRNGYKLSTCTGIPVEEILALSQVVDGYDKPVNGILSHTFVKGAYAERVLHRKVNWAAYAATKLKGQVVQWSRDGKGRPDGPPCVRKIEQKYSLPKLPIVKPISERKPPKLSCIPEKSTDEGGEERGNYWTKQLGAVLPSPQLNIASRPSLKSSSPLQVKNLLLSTIETEISKMKRRLVSVKEQYEKVKCTMNKIKAIESKFVDTDKSSGTEIENLRLEEDRISSEIATEEEAIEELTTDIELESNKQSDGDEIEEVNNELLAFMRTKLENHQATVVNLSSLLQTVRGDEQHVKDTLERMTLHRSSLPQTMAKLQVVSSKLLGEVTEIQSNLKYQEAEHGILSDVLGNPCPAVMPCYTFTSTETVFTEILISSCPICCNGYHCFNWTPASCGHTYHPACLFTFIQSSVGVPQCKSCGEIFSNDWLRTWGLEGPHTKIVEHQAMKLQMEEFYGVNCRRALPRRVLVGKMAAMQAKDVHLIGERCLASGLPSSTVEDDATDYLAGEDRSSKIALVSPKLEDGESGKKRKLCDLNSSRKVIFIPLIESAQPLQHVLTPSATLPFSPEAEIVFKTYSSLKAPSITLPSPDSTGVDARPKKKLKYKK